MAKIMAAQEAIDASLKDLEAKCRSLLHKGITPKLSVIVVGDNPASALYVKNKKTFLEKLKCLCSIAQLPEDVSVKDYLDIIKKEANDKSTHGIIVQLPVPKHLQKIDLNKVIPSSKDVDGFVAENIFKIFEGDNGKHCLAPCTPKGILTLLNHYKIPLAQKNVTIVGRGLIVGKPLSLMFTNLDATVTLCHSKTKNLESFTKKADIVVAAIGKAKCLGKTFFEKGQVVIDVGINRDENGKVCGDIDFEEVKDIVDYITPVPKGVGPMTILSLLENLIQAAQESLEG